MIFKCALVLLSVSLAQWEKVVTSAQKVRWEDEYSTTIGSTGSQNEFNGESRSINEDSENVNVNLNSDSVKNSNSEPVSKQYYAHQPPFSPPQFQPQFGNQFPPPYLSNNGQQNPWDWNPSMTTQQSRKPSFVQFPGEYPSRPKPATSYNVFDQNSGRVTSSSSSSLRIDDKCHCGLVPSEVNGQKLQRIVGGTVSKDNAWPWMVSITYIGQSKPFWFCGASLISEKFVLTAAHCLKTIKNFGLPNVKLIMGTNNIMDNKNAIHYSVRAVRQHPMYKSGTEDYDIALIEVKERVNFTSRVSPICLTQNGDPFINQTVTVAGWGSLQNGEGPPSDLREVDLKVVSNDICQKEYFYKYRTSITSSMICAWLPGKDSCMGDSGGPLFLKTTTSPYAYTQIGVVSFGPPNCGATTIPGVYSKVASSIRWIQSIAKSGKFCKGTF